MELACVKSKTMARFFTGIWTTYIEGSRVSWHLEASKKGGKIVPHGCIEERTSGGFWHVRMASYDETG